MKRWPLNKAYFWETVPFFRLLVPLIAGIIAYPYIAKYVQHPVYMGILLLLSIAGYTFSSFARQQKASDRYAVFICMHLSILLASWLICYYNDVRNTADWFGHTTATTDGYVATIKESPEEKEKTWKLEVDVTHAIAQGRTNPTTGKALVYVYKYNAPALREGDKIIIPNNWQEITNSGNPYEFDYAGYIARHNIYYRAFVSGDEVTIHKKATPERLNIAKRIHLWSVRQLEWHITDKTTLGLLKAILTGNKDTTNDTLTNAYANTGIVHIMAISGAHISVFFLLVAVLLIWVKHKRYRWVKYIAALPLIWLYVMVAGAPTSAIRAATMFSLLGIGFALQKSPNGVNQLLATAFILLCLNPYWLYDVGFQLSFTAVLSIFLFYKWVYRWYNPVNKVARALWSAIAVSIAAEILVAPLVVYYFHLFPLQFIIANVLAYMFMSVLLIGGLVLIAVSSFTPIAHFIADILTTVTTWFNSTIYYLQDLNFDSFHRLTLNEIQLISVYICIAGVAVFLIKKHKQALYIGLSFCCIFLISSCAIEWQALHQQKFIVYNNTDGAYIELITGKKSTVLYNTGTPSQNTERYVLSPAHINMHVKDMSDTNSNFNIFRLKGKTIFIMSQPVKDTTIQADYVVLTKSKGVDITTIKEVFNNPEIILSSGISKSRAETWVAETNAVKLKVYDVRSNGAFMLQ